MGPRGNLTNGPAPDGARSVEATGIDNKGQIVGNAQLGRKVVIRVWTPAPAGGDTVSVSKPTTARVLRATSTTQV